MSNLSRRDFTMTAGLEAAAGIGGQLSVSPALNSVRTNFQDLREVITMPGVDHTPLEERPEEINAMFLSS